VKLTLSIKKTEFFTKRIKLLGCELTTNRLRPSLDKIVAIRDYLRLVDKDSLVRFVYILLFLRTMILGRTNLVIKLKTSLVTELQDSIGKKRRQ